MDYVFDKTLDEFVEDIQCQDAVIRRIEIIGEAARRVTPETPQKFPENEWREMTSMRNLVIHEYDVVDIQQVWDTVQNKIPPLIEILTKFVPPEE
ncbi:MAG: HepT-like ribonuclease domain-containing protein [Chloroflexota bacterium]